MFANKRISWILLAGIIFSAGCSKKDPEIALVSRVDAKTLKVSPEVIQNLKIEKVDFGDFPDSLSIMGKVSVPEDRTSSVPARVGGRVDNVFVSTGETVKPGQALVSIFSSDFVIAREEYKQTAKQLRDNPSDDEGKKFLNLSRQKLRSLGMGPSDIEGIEKSTTENMTIRAARGGAILDKKVVVGNVVNAGDTLFTLGDLSKVWFTGDIYPENLAKIHLNQKIQIQTAPGMDPIIGSISLISPVVDPSTRTIKVRAVMDNRSNALRADMYLRANLILSESRALLVPKNSILRQEDKLYAFVAGIDGLFRKVEVTISGDVGNFVAIGGGLTAGSSVVSEGSSLLDNALTGSGT